MVQRMDQTKSCKFVVYSKTFLDESDDLCLHRRCSLAPAAAAYCLSCITDVTSNCCTYLIQMLCLLRPNSKLAKSKANDCLHHQLSIMNHGYYFYFANDFLVIK